MKLLGCLGGLKRLAYFLEDFDEGILPNLLCRTEASVKGGQCGHDPSYAQCRATAHSHSPLLSVAQQDVTVAQTDLKLGSKIVSIVQCARVHILFAADNSVKCQGWDDPRSPELSNASDPVG